MAAVTDKDILRDIIERMEQGVLPWRQPWSSSTATVVVGSMKYSTRAWPSNLRAPRVPFGIFNGTLLRVRASLQNYRSNLWVTEGAVKDLDAKLVEDDDKPVEIRPYLSDSSPYRRYEPALRNVYNVDQVEDCERSLGLTFVEKQQPVPGKRYKRSERLLEKLASQCNLRLVPQDIAAYSPSWDVVMMPYINQFDAEEREANYWATLWHEVVHWTGHRSRLNRERHIAWGDRTYAFEELVAELGAAFLCAHLDIEGELQHESYLASWCDGLRENPDRALRKAAVLATAAKEFVLAREYEKSTPGHAGK